LEASQGLVGLFGMYYSIVCDSGLMVNSIADLLGSTAFVVVQTDLKGNIAVRHLHLVLIYAIEPLLY
jgi:hypothetical protein